MSAWGHLCELAANGPKRGEEAEAEAFIAAAERMTATAREHLRPVATTPAKARMQRFVAAKPEDTN